MTQVRKWSLLTAVAVLLVLAAGWFLLVSPKRSDAAGLRDDTATQEQANATLRTQLAQLKAQQKHLTEQEARLAVINGELPDNPALPALIRALSDAADGSGVDLVSISPGPPALAQTAAPTAVTPSAAPSPGTGKAAGTAAAAGAAAATAAIGQLAVIPITVNVTGGYADVEQFLGSLEDLPRSFLVSGLSLAPGAAKTAGPGATPVAGNPLNVNITGRVFMAAGRAAAPVTTPTAPAASATK